MAVTTDRNQVRESVVDFVIQKILDINTGETIDINRGSINPKVIRGGQIVNTDNDYSSNEKRVLFSNDYKAIFGYPGDFIDTLIDNCYINEDGTFENPDWSVATISYDDGANTLTFDNCTETSPGGSGDSPTGVTVTIPWEYVNSYLSQYVTFSTGSIDIDSVRAEQVLDTNIYELLPTTVTKQQRINAWFNEFYQLIGDIPPYNLDVDFDGVPDTWILPEITSKQNSYYSGSSIIENEQDGNIVRLNRHAQGTQNEGQTIQYLRDQLNLHLTDIDKAVNPSLEDSRPEYETKSDGYLKIRNLNQSILIRNEQQDDVGIIGPDVNDPLYLKDGFTVGMWVRFLDRTGGGTLFNFGNPVRSENPSGFRLETYTLHKYSKMRPDKEYTWDEYIRSHTQGSDYLHPEIETNNNYFDEEHDFFRDGDYERFIRLMVRESNNVVRESSVGTRRFKEGLLLTRLNMSLISKIPSNGEYPIIWPEDQAEADSFYPNRLLTYTRVPVDFNEWFYIVATYNPDIDEDGSHAFADTYAPDGVNTLKYFSEYWMGHVIPESQVPSENQLLSNENLNENILIGKYVPRSEFGNRCKVEVISRGQLLRGLGYKSDIGDIESDTQQTVGG